MLAPGTDLPGAVGPGPSQFKRATIGGGVEQDRTRPCPVSPLGEDQVVDRDLVFASGHGTPTPAAFDPHCFKETCREYRAPRNVTGEHIRPRQMRGAIGRQDESVIQGVGFIPDDCRSDQGVGTGVSELQGHTRNGTAMRRGGSEDSKASPITGGWRIKRGLPEPSSIGRQDQLSCAVSNVQVRAQHFREPLLVGRPFTLPGWTYIDACIRAGIQVAAVFVARERIDRQGRQSCTH